MATAEDRRSRTASSPASRTWRSTSSIAVRASRSPCCTTLAPRFARSSTARSSSRRRPRRRRSGSRRSSSNASRRRRRDADVDREADRRRRPLGARDHEGRDRARADRHAGHRGRARRRRRRSAAKRKRSTLSRQPERRGREEQDVVARRANDLKHRSVPRAGPPLRTRVRSRQDIRHDDVAECEARRVGAFGLARGASVEGLQTAYARCCCSSLMGMPSLSATQESEQLCVIESGDEVVGSARFLRRGLLRRGLCRRLLRRFLRRLGRLLVEARQE